MTRPWPHWGWSWPIRVGVATGAVALVVSLGRVVVTTPSAEAHADATFTVLYSFKGGTDGAHPRAGLVRDAAGNLYGTTFRGGSGFGTVFKLDITGAETVLHSFPGFPGGSVPYAGLVRDTAGNLYGTTLRGGNVGWGAVYKLDTTGKETVLHSFAGADGRQCVAGLIRDAAGNLYGTTTDGGAFGFGVVFKLDTTGAETVLYNFAGGTDGGYPDAGLVRDTAGNLYGTTFSGGASGWGTVFKLDTTGVETVLYSFAGFPDGAHPHAGLIRDGAGNLYGTTYNGGASGNGMVFKLDAAGAETVLYSFGGPPDGTKPLADLFRDGAGKLYGTTYRGGSSRSGTVFKLDTTGAETILHDFTGPDGQYPLGGLVRDEVGNLYGTTSDGGAFGQGTVFKLSR